MSVWSILLRVLLSLALVLNGATAAASVHMPMSHSGMYMTAAAEPVPLPQTAEAMPCQGHHEGDMASVKEPSSAADPAPAKQKHPSPDCCESGSCRCACMQHVQLVLPVLFVPAAIIVHVRDVSPLKPGHATPALPHLIRPPIS